MTKVLVRLHPEAKDSCVEVNSSSQLRVYSGSNCEELNFDTVGDGFYAQEDIFQEVGTSVASSFKNGKEALILALGQKGSGKSYSLFGNGGQAKGLIEMICYDLKMKGLELTLSCYQIFNEQILDLMSPVPRARQLKQEAKRSAISQLTEIKLHQHHNIKSLLESARKNRKSVKINSQNELTNSIVIVSVKAKKPKTSIERRLDIVELADYQSVFNDGRKLEVVGMNSKSMNSFIRMLHSKQNVFDYNSSKLTQILRDSLNGNCSKYVIAHVKPERKYLNQTLFTLELANKVKNIQEFKGSELSVGTRSDESSYEEISLRDLDSARRATVLRSPQNTPDNPLHFLVSNQKHFKNLIELYETRIYQMQKSDTSQIETEKKILQKVAHQYAAIVKNFPAFSEILVQNINLKQQQLISQKTICSPFTKKQHKPTSFSIPVSSLEMIPSNNSDLIEVIRRQNDILQQYQEIFCTFKQNLAQSLTDLSKHYVELERQQKTQTKLYYHTASIKDFIVEDEELKAVKSQLGMLKLENRSLKKRNKELVEERQQKEMGIKELEYLKSRLVDIRNSVVKDEENQKKLAQEIATLKREIAQLKQEQAQQNITIKKAKGVDRSYDRIDETLQTQFNESQCQSLDQGNTSNGERLSFSHLLLHRMDNKENLRNIKMRTCQDEPVAPKPIGRQKIQPQEHHLSKSMHSNLDKKQKKSKIEKSELERLRLILLRSKEKTTKSKLSFLDHSFKKDLVQSKSSILSRDQPSNQSSRNSSNRPSLSKMQNILLHKYRPFISDRISPQNKSSI